MDGTEERKDTSRKEDSSSEKQGTSEKEPKTFTEEQVEEISTKAVSDALATAGRTAKSLDEREEAIKKADERTAQEGRERREREIEAARDDPDKFTAVQLRHKQEVKDAELAKEKRDLDTEKEKHQETVKTDLETIRVFNRTKLAAEVAVAKGVSVDALLKLTKEDSREAMEATAKLLSEKKPPLRPDSSRTIGGKDIDKLTPDEMIKEGVRLKLSK